MIVQTGDVLLGTGDPTTFFVRFSSNSDRWWPCTLAEEGAWLVLEAWHESDDTQLARLISLMSDDVKQEWIFEGTFDAWSTLEKLV